MPKARKYKDPRYKLKPLAPFPPGLLDGIADLIAQGSLARRGRYHRQPTRKHWLPKTSEPIILRERKQRKRR